MTHAVSDIAFTPSVKAVQERLGSRDGYASMEQRGGWSDRVTPELAAFIAERDTMFIATTNAEGQPYIQHRGGPPGFLKIVDERTLGFADFSGNRQYITVGNLDDNPKAFIFLMDFANRRRIKIWGRAEVVENDDALREKLHDPEYGSDPERMFLFHIDAWDVNCPQHIKPRFTEEEIGESIQALRDRIAQLEAEVRSCEPYGAAIVAFRRALDQRLGRWAGGETYLMPMEQVFRWSFIAIFIASASISRYYRRKARMAGETISRRNEGRLAMLLRVLFALPIIPAFFAYMLNPRWMAWSMIPLPVWVRWVGVGLGAACLPLLWWLFCSIGSNISETVLTKKEHRLVTSGPYRWVRHPLYSVSMVLFFSYGMMASNWWMMLFIAIGLVMVVAVVIPREEEALVAKFGEDYEKYKDRVGKLVPRI